MTASSSGRWRPVRRPLLVVLVVAAILRVALVASYRVPAGDGIHYWKLARELSVHGRYAFAPEPAPLTYSRMPGYPLFLVFASLGRVPDTLGGHLVVATGWNVLLGLGTGALTWLVALELGLGAEIALIAAALLLASPLPLALTCYALTEPLATFLATLEVWLALRARRARRPVLVAAMLGAVAGYALLVRLDAITVVPLLILCLGAVPGGWRQRAKTLAAMAVVAVAVFAPWPLRNLHRFGEAHATSVAVRTLAGVPLSDAPWRWARTWSSSAPGESYMDLCFYRQDPLPATALMPAMYDSPEERAKVEALFRRYNRERLSPAVTEGFAALAQERRARRPFHVLVTLPLLRAYHLWRPIPEWELPLRVPWLGLPVTRPAFAVLDLVGYALALVGVITLLGRSAGPRARRIALLLVAAILARVGLFAYVIVANGVTQRFLVEVMPLVSILAAVGAARLVRAVRSRARAG